MKNYYQILGLSTNASDHEIKRVFRRLAITYHPDKNPLPEAEAFFKEINEAYEILGDQSKRAQYDQLLAGGNVSVSHPPAPAWHRDPVYRRRKQTGYRPRPQGPSQQMVFMMASLPFVNVVLKIAAFYCALLIIDYSLPSKIIADRVAPTASTDRRSSKILVTDGGKRFQVGDFELSYFPPHSEVKIHTSYLFSLLVKVENSDGTFVINKLVTIYRIFFFWPCSLILVVMFGLFWDRGVEFRFNTGVVAVLLLLLNIIFFFISRYE